MVLIPSDILCRFIRTRDWSTLFKQPTPQAFKQSGLSVWHKGWLDQRSVPLESLRIDSLEGAGQAHYAVDDFNRLAEQLALQVEIKHTPENAHPELERWKDAHYDVYPGNIPAVGKVLPQELRNLLTINYKALIPPDKYAKG